VTELKGMLEREVNCAHIARPVIVTLDAETKRIGFREKGCRHVYWLPIMAVFAMAVRDEKK